MNQDNLLALLQNHSSLSNLIKTIEYAPWSDVPSVKVNFHYIDFDYNRYREDDFIEYLANNIISFCLPQTEIQEVMANSTPQQLQELTALFRKAQNLFIEVSKKKSQEERAGEPGELILYCLLEGLLNAPQILAKMSLKLNTNIPVHGSDGIHVKFNEVNKVLTLFFGEAKLVANFKTAIQKALNSCIKIARNEDRVRTRELEIITSHLDVGKENAKLKKELIQYLSTYNRDSMLYPRHDIFACFIGFEYSIFKRLSEVPPEQIRQFFIDTYTKDMKKFAEDLKIKILESQANEYSFNFFILPFKSLKLFRHKFYKSIGMEYNDD